MRSSTDGDSERFSQLRGRYRVFAEREAKGASPLYEEFAQAVANDESLLRFIASLPQPKQQPNLVFAAVRHLYGTPKGWQDFAQLIQENPEAIRALILRRSTQTNEPARCATLLPVLGQLPQPLALIEVGASAGLCLLPDRYRYDYGRVRLEPAGFGVLQAPSFPCRANEATPIPEQLPQVAWRAGLDVNPLDLADPEAAAWLETLVWPGQEERAERLRAAVRLARRIPLPIMKGDLLTDLPALAAEAPEDATLVIFHSAVLAYVGQEEQERFAHLVKELDAIWISNEAPGVMPWLAEQLEEEPPPDKFLLSVNGKPVAFTGPHGQAIDWLH